MKKFKPITEALADHFHLRLNEIMLPTPEDYDDEFKVFNMPIEVLTRQEAINTIYDDIDDGYVYGGDSDYINYHRRLANTDYFFRWL